VNYFTAAAASAPWARSALATVALLLFVGVDAAQAQAPTLDRVEELVRDGRVPEARMVLETWWATERNTADPSKLERAIWLRARSTPQAEQAEFLFRRLVREFPDGPYAEGARERLTMLAAARSRQPDSQPANTRQRSGPERQL